MNDGGGLSKADMIAAAKKKLKDYESRRNVDSRNSPTCSIVTSEPGGANGRNGGSSCISEESARNTDASLQINGATTFNSHGNEWYHAYTQLKAQHDELCSHYSQLHTAYSQINSSGIHVDAEKQIVQLQTALSTMVEEKLNCQAELRKAREEIENMITNAEKTVPVENVKNSDTNSYEIQNLTSKISEKDSLLHARHLELENLRKEMANIEASLLNVQHERSEAQARIKGLIRDNSNLEQNIQQLRKDIQMKDLHLKQLGAGIVMNESINGQSNNDNLELLVGELNALKAEKSRLLCESAALKSHYAEREQSLQKTQAELALELETINSIRFTSDARIEQLENQLHLANLEIEKMGNMLNESDEISEKNDKGICEEVVNKRVKDAVNMERSRWENIMENEKRNQYDENLEKDKIIFEKEQLLSELEMRYRLLEERTLESSASGADLLSISEQLQNEKATVSRAVAQNRELKQKLIETEDRLIVVTEEKLQIELAKQSAEHQVRELSKQLNLETAGLVPNISECMATETNVDRFSAKGERKLETSEDSSVVESNQKNWQDRINILEKENAEVRGELEHAVAQLAQVRAELRRSNTQNEQMDEIMRQNAEDENQNSIHVELTQAITRVNELASENQQLREAVSDMEKELNEERTRAFDSERKLNEIVENDRGKDEDKKEVKSKQNDEEEEWARRELEKRFARAMMENAELIESIERIEHINQQLQLENDTIADHVVLYQHQRKLIRERLRVKDEQLRAMEEDRLKTVSRCQELQNVLMNVLNKGGVLKEYEINSLTRKAARKVSRSYSHSTVDEMSGDEDVLVDGKMEVVPERENRKTSREEAVPERSLTPNENNIEQDASVRRILEIISDLSHPPPIVNGQLHCTQCIGELKDI